MDFEKIEALHEEGESLYDEGEYEKAAEVLTKALNGEERHRSFYMRGHCYYELNQYENALDDINSAIGIYDRDTDYHALKGVLLAGLDRYDEAVKSFTRNVELNPAVVNYGNRAIMYKKMGEYNKAIEDYTTIIDMTDDKSHYYVSRSTVYRLMNRLDKVWEDLEMAIESDPDNISTYLDTAELYITTECYREGYDFVTKYQSKVMGPGTGRDKLLFLYLKAIVHICLNISIESFEDDIEDLASEGYLLEWNFSHLREWIDGASLSEDKKEKLKAMTDMVEFD